jgi:DNA-binding XRE family transcriptional regulator
MSEEHKQRPFGALGQRLRAARVRASETVAEVSGAVEIDSDILESIEQGLARPSEEVLMLLITHLEFEDDEATKLWELAGYTRTAEQADMVKQIAFAMPTDNRVIYTDMVHVMVNDYGVVMNFMQNLPGGQPQPIARLGMSKEHAKSVLEVIKNTLEQAEKTKNPRFLNPPKTDKK